MCNGCGGGCCVVVKKFLVDGVGTSRFIDRVLDVGCGLSDLVFVLMDCGHGGDSSGRSSHLDWS